MIKTILYPTDLGIYSNYMLQQVLALAEDNNARIVIMHAIEPMGVFADAVLETYVPREMMGELKAYGLDAVMDAIRQQVLEAFQQELIDSPYSSDRIVDVRVLKGQPADMILQESVAVGADLITLGSCGVMRDLPLLGATASKVLQLSQIPVYLIPVAYTQHYAQNTEQRPLF